MGADFLLVIAPVPDTRPEAIAELHARADSLDESQLAQIMEACLGDDEDGYPRAKALLHRAIDEIVGGSRRDVGEFVIDGVTYAATGGWSWGDDPTEAWELVVALDASALTWDQIPTTATRDAITRALAQARAATGGNPVLLQGTSLVAASMADCFAEAADNFDRASFLRDCGATDVP